MGGTDTLVPCSSRRRHDKIQAKAITYFEYGGLLIVGNLLKTDLWIDDALRSHCIVCFQHFFSFRRRHHCRTCGEVVCRACSSQRPIRLTDINVECETRVCTLCVVQARDASFHHPSLLNFVSPSIRRENQQRGIVGHFKPNAVPLRSALGLTNEISQLERDSSVCSAEIDPTLNLLVNIVARTLKCPVALIGIMDDASFQLKASVGLDKRVTCIPKNDCVCMDTLIQDRTVVVDDTLLTQDFQAQVYAIGSSSMRYYAGAPVQIQSIGNIGVLCALDTEPHSRTTNEMKSTLEALAAIVSEVLEQRMASGGTLKPPMKMRDSIDLSFQRRMDGPNTSLDRLDPLLRSQHKSFSSSEVNSYDSRRGTSYLSQQDADKIAKVMGVFKQLQQRSWCEHSIGSDLSCPDTIRVFELVYDAKVYTRSIMKMTGDCSTILAKLLNYETSFLYPEFFTHASSRYELDQQTFLDLVSVHTSITTQHQRILTHQKKYPDGSNVVVAMTGDDAADTPETSENGFLFGWYVAPCSPNGDVNSLVKVSCITAQLNQNQSQNLSLALLRRLYGKTSMTRALVQSNETEPFSVDPSEEPSSAQTNRLKLQANKESFDRNNKAHIETQALDPINGVNKATKSSREGNHTTLVAVHDAEQVSELNDIEQMLMEFLDKTIGTHEILVQRQHEMANILDIHGTQLQRISSVLIRMESILTEKEKRRDEP